MIAAVIFNAIPIVGVALWGWNAFALIFLYWLENLVIGVRTIAAMAASALATREMNALGFLFFAGFFLVHYGIFCYGHGVFIVTMFAGEEIRAQLGSFGDVAGAGRALFAAEPNLTIGLASIVFWQAVGFILFLARGEPGRTNPMALMGAPYPRIVLLHVGILGGGFVLTLLGQPVAGLIALAVLKMAFDVAGASGVALRMDKAPDKPWTKPRRDSAAPSSLQGPSTRR